MPSARPSARSSVSPSTSQSKADLLSFANDEPDFYPLTFVAFVGGFSERFAPDVFGKVDGTKEKDSSPPAATPATDFASTVLPDDGHLADPSPEE